MLLNRQCHMKKLYYQIQCILLLKLLYSFLLVLFLLKFHLLNGQPLQPVFPPGVKRLTWAEQQERRTKRLCFNNDEHYKLGQICKKSKLLLLYGAIDMIKLKSIVREIELTN